MAILIFANGDLSPGSWLAPYIDKATAVIGVDGGALHLLDRQLRPDYLVGDFDSLPAALVADIERQGAEIIRHPAAKNETDLELALLFAVGRDDWQKETLLIFGVLGGRLDQTLANILLLAHPELINRDIRIIEEQQRAWLVSSQTIFEGEIGDTVSLIPLGGPVEIHHTSGLQWPLNKETLSFGPARGVSNRLIAQTGVVEVAGGLLLIIHSRGAWTR